jgi:hypothetical protein
MKVTNISVCSVSVSAEFKLFSVTLSEHQRQAKEVRLDEAEGEFKVRRCVFFIGLTFKFYLHSYVENFKW